MAIQDRLSDARRIGQGLGGGAAVPQAGKKVGSDLKQLFPTIR
jgi:hypothetical protein